jgi:hypothetical protein
MLRAPPASPLCWTAPSPAAAAGHPIRRRTVSPLHPHRSPTTRARTWAPVLTRRGQRHGGRPRLHCFSPESAAKGCWTGKIGVTARPSRTARMCGLMKLLLTGGCGFIGSAVVRHLLRSTDHVVINVNKMTYAASEEGLRHNRHILRVRTGIHRLSARGPCRLDQRRCQDLRRQSSDDLPRHRGNRRPYAIFPLLSAPHRPF